MHTFKEGDLVKYILDDSSNRYNKLMIIIQFKEVNRLQEYQAYCFKDKQISCVYANQLSRFYA